MGKNTKRYKFEELVDALVECYRYTNSLSNKNYRFYRKHINDDLPVSSTISARTTWVNLKIKARGKMARNNIKPLPTTIFDCIEALQEAMIETDYENLIYEDYKTYRRKHNPALPSARNIAGKVGFNKAKELAKENYYEYKAKKKNQETLKKIKSRVQFINRNCPNCVWRIDKPNNEKYNCMFRRCVKRNGWFVDKIYKEVKEHLAVN